LSGTVRDLGPREGLARLVAGQNPRIVHGFRGFVLGAVPTEKHRRVRAGDAAQGREDAGGGFLVPCSSQCTGFYVAIFFEGQDGTRSHGFPRFQAAVHDVVAGFPGRFRHPRPRETFTFPRVGGTFVVRINYYLLS
jgi:hypothetical protein